MTAKPPNLDTAVTDHDILARKAYKTDKDLSARQNLYQWQTPRYDLPLVVREQLSRTFGTVVDVGCGNGRFIKRLIQDRADLHVLGLDISQGILRGVPGAVAVADAMRLPLASSSMNAALALHMLYHVADIPTAIREFSRVIVPGGMLLVSTNGELDKAELDELWELAAGDILGVERGPARISLSARFPLEKAADYLRPEFSSIRTILLPGTISVTTPEPIVSHLRSYRAWADQHAVPFEETIIRASEILSRHIDQKGSFDINCIGGILVCAKSRKTPDGG